MGNFILGLTDSTFAFNLDHSRKDFVNKYGDTSSNYDLLDQLGNMNNRRLLIGIFIMSVILCAIAFNSSTSNNDSGNLIIPTKSKLLRNILYYIGWFFVIVTLFTIGYSSYLYFLVYLPQYYKWYNNLSSQAQKDLIKIITLNNVTNFTSDFRYNS